MGTSLESETSTIKSMGCSIPSCARASQSI